MPATRATTKLGRIGRRFGRENSRAVQKGAQTAGHEKIGELSREKLREIAKIKAKDLNAKTIEAAERIVEGTARSMGIEIEK